MIAAIVPPPVARRAATLCAEGAHDLLVVLGRTDPEIPGEQDDDDVRAVAAIDVLRYLVADYEDGQTCWRG